MNCWVFLGFWWDLEEWRILPQISRQNLKVFILSNNFSFPSNLHISTRVSGTSAKIIMSIYHNNLGIIVAIHLHYCKTISFIFLKWKYDVNQNWQMIIFDNSLDYIPPYQPFSMIQIELILLNKSYVLHSIISWNSKTINFLCNWMV